MIVDEEGPPPGPDRFSWPRARPPVGDARVVVVVVVVFVRDVSVGVVFDVDCVWLRLPRPFAPVALPPRLFPRPRRLDCIGKPRRAATLPIVWAAWTLLTAATAPLTALDTALACTPRKPCISIAAIFSAVVPVVWVARAVVAAPFMGGIGNAPNLANPLISPTREVGRRPA